MKPSQKNFGPKRPNNPRHEQRQQISNGWDTKFRETWISDRLDSSAIDFADEFGKSLAENKLTTNQIRNFFGEVRRIEMKGILQEKTRFLLLAPKLAYAAKRADIHAAESFKKVMTMAHQVVIREENDDKKFEHRFKNFVQFLEAILAYHKAYGGK